MLMTTEAKQILAKLDAIESELSYIKQHLVDMDAVLTDDDILALKKAEDNLKAGKTKRLN